MLEVVANKAFLERKINNKLDIKSDSDINSNINCESKNDDNDSIIISLLGFPMCKNTINNNNKFTNCSNP